MTGRAPARQQRLAMVRGKFQAGLFHRRSRVDGQMLDRWSKTVHPRQPGCPGHDPRSHQPASSKEDRIQAMQVKRPCRIPVCKTLVTEAGIPFARRRAAGRWLLAEQKPIRYARTSEAFKVTEFRRRSPLCRISSRPRRRHEAAMSRSIVSPSPSFCK